MEGFLQQGNCSQSAIEQHYEKSWLPKPHYPTTKLQKTTRIQLLCNYPWVLQLLCSYPPYKYEELMNNCHNRKLVNCIILVS